MKSGEHSTFNIQRPAAKGRDFVNQADNYHWQPIRALTEKLQIKLKL